MPLVLIITDGMPLLAEPSGFIDRLYVNDTMFLRVSLYDGY